MKNAFSVSGIQCGQDCDVGRLGSISERWRDNISSKRTYLPIIPRDLNAQKTNIEMSWVFTDGEALPTELRFF